MLLTDGVGFFYVPGFAVNPMQEGFTTGETSNPAAHTGVDFWRQMQVGLGMGTHCHRRTLAACL